MSNHSALYHYAKSVFDEELSRYHRVQHRANLFITILISLLAIYGVIIASDFGKLIRNGDVVILFLGILVPVGFLTSFVFAFLSLKDKGLDVPPLNERILSFFTGNKLDDVYYAISNRYSESLKNNRKITDNKMRLLTYSYWSVIITVILFVSNMVWIMVTYSESRIPDSALRYSNQAGEQK